MLETLDDILLSNIFRPSLNLFLKFAKPAAESCLNPDSLDFGADKDSSEVVLGVFSLDPKLMGLVEPPQTNPGDLCSSSCLDCDPPSEVIKTYVQSKALSVMHSNLVTGFDPTLQIAAGDQIYRAQITRSGANQPERSKLVRRPPEQGGWRG